MLKASIIFLLSLPLWVTPILFAQTYSLPTIISSSQGLSQNTVRDIIQDHNGFLWFATDDGLNKYNGYTFTVYRNNPRKEKTLSCNSLTCLFEDSHGKLWIGTERGGLINFDLLREEFTAYRHDSADASSISGDHITTIIENRNKELWIGTTTGLNRFNPENGTFSQLDICTVDSFESHEYHITSLLEDSKDAFWIGTTNKGLYCYNTRLKTSIVYNKDPTDSTSISSNNIACIFEDTNGGIWIGSGLLGLNLFNREKNTFQHFLPRNDSRPALSSIYVRNIKAYDAQTIAVLTNRSVDLVNINTHVFQRIWANQEFTNPISFCIDASKIIWVGSSGTGVGKLHPIYKNFKTVLQGDSLHQGLSFSGVRAIYEDHDGDLWIGGHIGLNRLSKKERLLHPNYRGATWEEIKAMDGVNVFSVIEDPINNHLLWIGTEGAGIFRLDKNNFHRTHFTSSAKDPHQFFLASHGFKSIVTKRKELYIGSEWGLSKWNPEEIRFENFTHNETDEHSIGEGSVKAILEDTEGFIWIGTDIGGISILNPATAKFSHFKADRKNQYALSDNKVNAIFQDSRNTIWIATSMGLNKFNKDTKQFQLFTTDNGLANDNIYAIEEDTDGNLWMSTNKGISKFNTTNDIFLNYDYQDGLQGDEFNTFAYFKSTSGELFFGGIKGCTSFFPQEIKMNLTVPKVLLTGFKKFNQPFNLGKPIQYCSELLLSYTDNVFSFEFTALEFTEPKKNKFAYRMEGFDENWRYIDADQRTAAYTNLDAGTYTFRVKASNNDGVWNNNGTSLQVVITPPFWKTWVFRITALCLLFGFIYLAYRIRFRDIQHQRAMKQKLAHQLIESQEAERKRIASEMHDAIGQDLLIIKNLSFMALEDCSNENREKFLNEISSTASQTIEDVRKISHNLRPYQIDKLGLTRAMESLLLHIAKTSTIRFSYDIDSIDGLFLKEQEIHVYRILQECVNNIIKHSDAHEAVVTIRKTASSILLTVKDDGKGLPEDTSGISHSQHLNGFGITGIAERVSILNGQFLIRSLEQKGTTLTMNLPILGPQHGR